jgi:hypothetical protein
MSDVLILDIVAEIERVYDPGKALAIIKPFP